MGMTSSLFFVVTLVLGIAFPAQEAAQEAAKDGPGHRFGRTEPLPKHDGSIRIVSYNMLNMFDQTDDPGLEGEYDDLPMATNDDRCRALAKAITAMDADILCVQEVESEEALKWFRDTYIPELGYDHIASRDVGYYRGVEQGVLSRYPISAITTWSEEDLSDMQGKKAGGKDAGWADCDGEQGSSFQRSPIMVDVEIPATADWIQPYEISLVVVHHKSGRDYNCQRESEALQIVELLEKRVSENPDVNLVVLGDFNASPSAKSVAVYQDAGFKNAYGHRWQKTGNTRDLFRTHESNRAIDYIMLHPNVWTEAVPKSFQVVGTLHPGDDYNWRTDEPPPGYAADHYPLAIDVTPIDRPVPKD